MKILSTMILAAFTACLGYSAIENQGLVAEKFCEKPVLEKCKKKKS